VNFPLLQSKPHSVFPLFTPRRWAVYVLTCLGSIISVSLCLLSRFFFTGTIVSAGRGSFLSPPSLSVWGVWLDRDKERYKRMGPRSRGEGATSSWMGAAWGAGGERLDGGGCSRGVCGARGEGGGGMEVPRRGAGPRSPRSVTWVLGWGSCTGNTGFCG